MASYTALVNPVSGGGRAATAWDPVGARLRTADADVDMQFTRGRDHAVEAAAAACAAGRVVIAVGGDGLVRDVAEGVVRAGGVMGVVPAGRGNDLARRLRLPSGAGALAALLLTAHPRVLDVIDLDGTVVVGNVYCGIDAVATGLINRTRWLPGSLVYRLAPVRAVLTWQPPLYTLTIDGETRQVRAHTIVVGNSGAYGHGLQIVPSAEPDDGRLDVLVVGAGPRRAIAAFMREARSGTHVHRPEVEVVPAREVTIAADRPVPVCGDGEQFGTVPATARIRPSALRILAPG
jgi:diacylglycerol kinase (ATP)